MNLVNPLHWLHAAFVQPLYTPIQERHLLITLKQ
jgi:hypothetical protein